MHILTKVFVVLAALLSLLLSALTITYSVNAEQIRSQYEDARLTEQTALTAANVMAVNAEQQIGALKQDLQSKDEQISRLTASLREQESMVATLQREVRSAEARAEAIRSEIMRLGVAAETQTKLIESYKEEVGTLRDAEIANRQARLDLEDTNADLQSQLQVFEQTNRALRETVAELQRMNENLGSGAPRTATASAASSRPIPVAGPKISGSVRSTRTEASTGKKLVQIDLGSNDGLRVNNQLYVIRGTNFIGNIVLRSVDLQESVAEVTLTRGESEVRPGDTVVTNILARN